jgi:hypothetical protein
MVGDPVVDAYARLLDELLTTDKPAVTIAKHQATGCLDVTSSRAAREALTRAVIDQTFPSGDIRDIVEPGPMTAGGRSFLHWLNHAVVALNEAAEAPHRDPLDPGDEVLLGLRALLARELQALVTPAATMEVSIRTDGEECSEFVVGLFDPRDETLVILHIHPMC